MKNRLATIAILLLALTILFTRNDERITEVLLGVINPIKQKYKHFIEDIQAKGHSYIFQKESIQTLGVENRVLRKRLLEQTHYIQQVKNIYTVLPELSKLPIHNISISETISYVKLNSFSQIILTKPKELKVDKLYGLIQENVVAGIAELRKDQLYGYLTSDTKCRFSVFIGDENAPGIATGVSKNEMFVKFIPKWYKIKEGDKVITSGLDDIFFRDVPVGVVTKVELQSSYKVAYIQTYSDIYHPETFFLVNDAKASLARGFDSNATRLKPFKVLTSIYTDINVSQAFMQKQTSSQALISSIPSRIDQTQEEVIEPPVAPVERATVTKPKKIVKKKNQPKSVQKKKIIKNKVKNKVNNKVKKKSKSTLDLF